MESAKDILDRLKSEYANNAEALELIDNSYDDVLAQPSEVAVRQAKDCERVLSLYY